MKNKKQIIKNIIKNTNIKENLQINPNEDKMIEIIEHYIDTHKWLINENIKYEITCDQAIFSWYENVYHPLWFAMKNSLIFKAFPNKKPFELFSEISDAHYLKNNNNWVPYENIIKEYILKNSKKNLIKFLVKIGF